MMKLLEDVAYVDPDGSRWTAHKGYATDGASIPRVFWTIVGGPFEGRYRSAAVIHDQYCSDPKHGLRTWREVHRMFYLAMRASGVAEIESKVLYAAVFLGGPRWTSPCQSCASVSLPERDSEGRLLTAPTIESSDAEEIRRWIEQEAPSLDSIDIYLNSNFARVPIGIQR